MYKMHGIACVTIEPLSGITPVLARLQIVDAVALKPPYEECRRGGDSIARWPVLGLKYKFTPAEKGIKMAELSSQPITIQSIYSWYRDGKLLVNRRYQRKLVWTLEEKQKLIESLLNKYPIPAILLAERENTPGTFEIIDGLQRLHAIISFIELNYPTSKGFYFDAHSFPTVKTKLESEGFDFALIEKNLDKKEVSTILDYALSLSIMRSASEKQVNDVFDRINTYGHRLSDQERRQAGVQSQFSKLIREISCTLRGDVSSEILPLEKMPSISIDLPSMKHGYDIQAEEVFWVKHGILRSTDLRDSLDEQCIADITACIVLGALITRSKDALDKLYNDDTAEFSRIDSALKAYGEERFSQEFKFCIEEIMKVCENEPFTKLRDVIFSKKNTNPFQSIFSLIVIAFHELIFKDNLKVINYERVRASLNNLADKVNSDRTAGLPEERRKHINIIKGLIKDCFIENDKPAPIYKAHSTLDIEGLIRRSEAELAFYELKQGVVTLADDRKVDHSIFGDVIKTICAMANNGKSNGIAGKIVLGIADKVADANRVEKLDGVKKHTIGNRYVVGVSRELKILNKTPEEYIRMWSEEIRKSKLSEPLKSQVLSSLDWNDFYGKGLFIITVPEQNDVSDIDELFYWRDADNTKEAKGKEISMLTKRF
ncbi:GmrSD restriction endonuclease domain-containing protein [Cronobacter malonaticus]